MPTYFDVTLLFKKERLKSNFVKNLYYKIISCGFEFKSGFWFHEDANFNEIIEWNQNLLEQGFKLGFTQHVKHDYMQILFESQIYSQLRGFWTYSEKEISFSLIVPEYDIIKEDENYIYFIKEKIDPLKKLAIHLWESNFVDAIYTSLELYGMHHSLYEVCNGIGISVTPFAIIGENNYKCFNKDYFIMNKKLKIDNNGILIENDKDKLIYQVYLETNDVCKVADFYKEIFRIDNGSNDDTRQLIITRDILLTIYNNGLHKNNDNENISIVFTVDDVDEEYKRLLKLGVEILKKPESYPWGTRDIQFLDPDGNCISFRTFIKE